MDGTTRPSAILNRRHDGVSSERRCWTLPKALTSIPFAIAPSSNTLLNLSTPPSRPENPTNCTNGMLLSSSSSTPTLYKLKISYSGLAIEMYRLLEPPIRRPGDPHPFLLA
ncbi:hypothetical protein CVT25_006546 [Psilocybe cyanescens]|uniref:Uncharacterized protein n=1 Tax=Psilocybe cyanescens TaxID=93625 RepID=A0A409W232_PSICY|nr:hypothetical protein CVT25_006546 [Psilocybe cyanescens]